VLALTVALWTPGAIAQETTIQSPNCGITSVSALAQVRGLSLTTQVGERLLKEYPQQTVSLADVKKIAASVGIPLSGVKATLGDLLEMQRPAIIHLTKPDHFVLLLDASKEHVRLLEGPQSAVTVVSRADIERRFDGYALILQDEPASNNTDAPRVRFDETDFQIGITGIGQKVEHDYRFTNTGKQNLIVSLAGST
jgi:ABC-type bacteriocin/lantibiotic exporter with double-glycine peptidase domain